MAQHLRDHDRAQEADALAAEADDVEQGGDPR
jgi:hypothetical protein